MPTKGKPQPMGGPLFGGGPDDDDPFPVGSMAVDPIAEVRLEALEEAAAFCAKLGHPHAASEIRRQLIKGDVRKSHYCCDCGKQWFDDELNCDERLCAFKPKEASHG